MFNKIIKPIIGALAIAVFFTGCSASAKAGKNGWYVDYDAAKKEAQKKNKNLLIFFSVVDNDGESQALKEKVFDTKEFVSALSKRFILVNLDFSASLSEDTEDQSEKEKKKAEERQRKIEYMGHIASLYNVDSIPSVFLATKEGYYAAKIETSDEDAAPEAYIKLIESKSADLDKINTLADAVRAASGVEKVRAIDALSEATDDTRRLLLADLFRTVSSLDPENETGLVGKYILLTSVSDASTFYAQRDFASAIQALASAAEDKRLGGRERQQAYYYAGELLTTTGSTDYKAVFDYFQKSYDADPESEYAPRLAEMLRSLKEEIERISGDGKQR
ncbi:thioredoxin family protein [Treponema sp. Marseille-Q4132]|uniref:thioredoxin family protein n=1 Tax=Treponema sp. Marseille-Q4132 TaxID=2766701 RepID=UPI001652D33B|nr:thioredoxin family protein [Treponema sp. Marseille-Q4132]QNL96897.1 thioredoxin family protein [Treponema sp. Marseille-Q4132]